LAPRRRSGGGVGGGCRRGGSSASSSTVASATLRTALSKDCSVRLDVVCTPLTFRTYWCAAASISSIVASGCKPRSVVMLRHTCRCYACVYEPSGAKPHASGQGGTAEPLLESGPPTFAQVHPRGSQSWCHLTQRGTSRPGADSSAETRAMTGARLSLGSACGNRRSAILDWWRWMIEQVASCSGRRACEQGSRRLNWPVGPGSRRA